MVNRCWSEARQFNSSSVSSTISVRHSWSGSLSVVSRLLPRAQSCFCARADSGQTLLAAARPVSPRSAARQTESAESVRHQTEVWQRGKPPTSQADLASVRNLGFFRSSSSRSFFRSGGHETLHEREKYSLTCGSQPARMEARIRPVNPFPQSGRVRYVSPSPAYPMINSLRPNGLHVKIASSKSRDAHLSMKISRCRQMPAETQNLISGWTKPATSSPRSSALVRN